MHQTIKANHKMRGNQNESGVFLIELAIFMVVFAIMLVVAIPLYENYEQRNARLETKKRMDIISKSFSNFSQMRWRLPCPANSAGVGGTQYGIERLDAAGLPDCSTNIEDAHGIVPYRTLGIPEQYAKDAYGNFFTYVVSPDFTVDNRLGVQIDEVNKRSAHLVGGDLNADGDSDDDGNYALLPRAQFCNPLINTVSDISVIQDGNPLYTATRDVADNIARGVNAPDINLEAMRQRNVTAVAMALISHGENGFGSYQSNGTQTGAGQAGPSEQVTIDNSNRTVQVESQYSDTGANRYDDIVMFFTQDDIYAASGNNSCENL